MLSWALHPLALRVPARVSLAGENHEAGGPRTRSALWILVGLLGLSAAASPASAQTATVTADSAEFRVEPEGTLLATILRGVRVRSGGASGEWRQATLEGWIWAESVEPDERPSHDLRVSVSGGENLRAEPNERVLARLRTGMLLDSLERQGAWIRVRRSAWLRQAALGRAAEPEGGGAPPGTDEARPDRIGRSGTAVVGSPAGDTLGSLRPMTAVEVLSREGEWTRVRLEGWVRTSGLGEPGDTDAVSRDVTAAALGSDPDGFRGRLVEWTVEFIALDTAGSIRTDLREGEPFILARPPDDDTRFVYLAVPPGLVDEVERLSPLQSITVRARVRVARSALMDAPVLELVAIE